MSIAEIALSIGAGMFLAVITAHFTVRVINAMFPARQAMLVKPFAIPAALYAVALWKAADTPYVAATIAIVAIIRFGIFAGIVITELVLTKWEEVLVEAVF